MKDNEHLEHYGTPRHSGRYPWGSGGDPYQRSSGFLQEIASLRKQGLSEVDIATMKGISVKQLRETKTIERNRQKAADAAFAYRLKEKGYSLSAIGKRMGMSDHTVKDLLDPVLTERAKILETTANVLKNNISGDRYIDVGSGVEVHLGISRTKLDASIAMLKEQGYEVHNIPIEQLGTGKYTWTKVLAPPGTSLHDVSVGRDKIKLVDSYSEDGGLTMKPILPPISIDGKRVFVRYGDEGGSNKDGVIELRRNVEDLTLGDVNYAQVRVAVDGNKFMKGMAMYGNNIPDGYDIVYNTNKPKGTPDEVVFKEIKNDPEYPFGSVVRQKTYKDSNGNDLQSPLNIVAEEGDWGTWSKSLSSQILSKQNPSLAKKQLDLDYDLRKEEYDEIMSLTNPAVKQALLKPFADSCDSAAVDLKAAALPRQASYVILPVNSLKPGEIYAPKYIDGENVVLIRHPHGGIFEIPEVVINNKNPEARSLLGDADDAIGIHPDVAKRLSGADFDGDAVILIPNKSGAIKTSPALKSLKDFDPKEAYRGFDGMRVMDDKREKGIEMGKISNLITDMTIKGASPDEIARAVRHSMVVIDAPKHKLNFEQSYIDNNISQLKEKYQGSKISGASTLISKAGAEIRVDERLDRRRTKEEAITGEKLYKPTGRTYVKRTYTLDSDGNKVYIDEGQERPRKTVTTRMAEEKDAHKLSSGTRIERVYGDYANSLKALATKARVEMDSMERQPYSRSAKETYADAVSSLESKLRNAFRNKPYERQAQLIANRVVWDKKKANPHLDKADIKKIKGQELINARTRAKAQKEKIIITDREWEAIQAGAFNHSKVVSILTNADLKAVRQRAMPRQSRLMSAGKISRARQMLGNGYQSGEIADALGVSLSTLEKALE